MWIIITIIVIVALVIGLVWAVLAQRQAASQVGDFNLAKKALMDENVAKGLVAARKIALTGQSLHDYQELEKMYKQLRDRQFLAIDHEISQATRLAAGLNVWKTRQSLQSLLDLMTEAASLQKSIVNGLDRIEKQNQLNHRAIDQLHEEYPKIREKVLHDLDSFGPASAKLMELLEQEEQSYQDYQQYIEDGDKVKAAEVFEELGFESSQILDYMQNLPGLFQQLNQKYLDQMNEISDSWTDLVDRGVIFAEDQIQKGLDQVDANRLKGLQAIRELKLKEANSLSRDVNEQIQGLYDLLEQEYKAYNFYFKQQEQFSEKFDRVKEQNHSLMLELTYLRGRFALTHGEDDRQNEYKDEIEGIVGRQKSVQESLKAKEIGYTEAVEEQGKWLSLLEQLDEDQVALFKQIEEFQPALASAKKHSVDYIDQIRGLKRSLERRDLPGLPAEFLDQFFSVSDEMKRLDEAVAASEVGLDDVQRQLNIVAADFDTLKEAALDVLVQADLAVSLLQYSNRYRDDEQVAQAIKSGQALYQDDFDYAGVVNLLRPALTNVEPGAYERLVQNRDTIEL
ncbi:septation ring formation regulator EzrA [Fructobacillus pseudoficulneus]|uniref:Septation ring formation regulator EzrA n=1 Tax=Fructobacillus pseudoficulneus TaxID=220714 RepID=A0A3F3GUV4_9LACO|nr:septation ring formation regulator EzrA [Fructobacillus pseudoficulneus]GAP03181.1 septation ring formation regulator EzrA [Fructobacillus pseudoficulneus]SEH40792.1 septation ring formation regulator [Fructobacillus pseudoficulneus]